MVRVEFEQFGVYRLLNAFGIVEQHPAGRQGVAGKSQRACGRVALPGDRNLASVAHPLHIVKPGLGQDAVQIVRIIEGEWSRRARN